MVDNRNLILAVVLSIAILIGFELVYSPQRTPAPEPVTNGDVAAPAVPSGVPTDSAVPPAAGVPDGTATGSAVPTGGAGQTSREAALQADPRVQIDTPRLHGSILLRGGRLDDLTLADYHETIDPSSPEIVLLSPGGTFRPYFARFGWVETGGQAIKVPDDDTPWTADGKVLSPETPVTLTWDNGEGLRFERTFAIDGDYMVTVRQRVTNSGEAAVAMAPYGLISRHGTPTVLGFFILHEGPLGVFNDELKEIDYEDVQEDGVIEQATTGGWIGITDKYWLTALIPDQATPVQTRFVHQTRQTGDFYQVDMLGAAVSVPPGGVASADTMLFAGAKEVHLLDDYAEAFGIALFDRAIDFGWFYFLTKPIFLFLIWINSYVGNLGVAILLLTVAIKLVFFPLANKSYTAMSKMKKLQPEMMKLRERLSDDKVRLNQEMMALYKKEKVNPASGCLPMLVQIPVFFALYKVLFVTIEMRHAPFFGWIQDLSAPDPTTIFNLFGLIPWQPPEFLMIGIWPLIMGASMWMQQKLNPPPPDPMQAKIFMFLPILFTFLLARFPAGLVVYWAWNNVLSIAQQWVIMRRMGVKA